MVANGTHKKTAKTLSRAAERERLLKAAQAVELPAQVDVCVIGGGAAGILAAISASDTGCTNGLSVAVLEADLECGRTILATGNGRCNFSNVDLAPEHYNHPELASSIMGKPEDALEAIQAFFRATGLSWIEEDGRLYPMSRQAASVRNLLLNRIKYAGVIAACGRKVAGAKRAGGKWCVSYTTPWDATPQTLKCRSLIVCSGGKSGELLEALKLKTIEPSPVLCALSCQSPLPGLLEKLDGRRVRCHAVLKHGAHIVAQESGEVLFRTYGVSGIVIFNLSRMAQPGDMLELDLAPEVDAWEVDRLIATQWGNENALDGILDPVIAHELIEAAGGIQMEGLAWRVAPLVKGLPLRVLGAADTEHAQVSRGGVAVETLDAKVLAVKGKANLYACGEAVDIDGACGGYNLSWAWLSGLRAGADSARAAGFDKAEEEARLEEAAKKKAAAAKKRELEAAAAAKAGAAKTAKAAKSEAGAAKTAKVAKVAAPKTQASAAKATATKAASKPTAQRATAKRAK